MQNFWFNNLNLPVRRSRLLPDMHQNALFYRHFPEISWEWLIAPNYELTFISRALRYMARANEGSQFYLPPTRLSTSGMSHTCLYSPAAEHHRTLAGRPTHFPSR